MSNLAIITELLHNRYMPEEQSHLIENNSDGKQAFEVKYEIVKKRGIHYALYRYEEDAFPFFATGVSGLKKMCDYILFAEFEEERDQHLYIFLIELKLSNKSAKKQLEAGEQFAQFITKSAMRVERTIKPYVIRKIRICDAYTKKRSIKPKIEFDEEDYCEYKLGKIHLTALMEA